MMSNPVLECASIRRNTSGRCNCSNDVMNDTIFYRRRLFVFQSASGLSARHNNKRHINRKTFSHKPFRSLTDIVNGIVYAGGIGSNTRSCATDIPGQVLNKKASLPLAEGEGFEPPGLLTQLFSRQPP